MKEQNWKKSIILFLTAQTISMFGSSLVQYAIIWYITLSTSSGKMLAISTVCGFLPQVLISLFSGVWVDKYNRKKLIMLADSIIALSTLALIIAFVMGYGNIWLLFLTLLIRSAGAGVQTPAFNAIIPQIVPQEHLMRINGINNMLSSITFFLSPAISAFVLSLASLEVVLLIDVVTAVIGVGITSTIFIKAYEKREHQSSLTELKIGIKYIKENRFIKAIFIFQLIIFFLLSPSAFLTPLMVNRTFGVEIWRLSANEMTFALGMFLGGLLLSTWGGFKNKINTTLLAGIVYGAFMFGIGIAPTFLLYLICNTMIGVSAPFYSTPLTVIIQEKIEPNMHGRVFSFMQIATSSAMPLGMLIFGPLADIIYIQNILIINALIICMVSAILWKTNYFNKLA